MILILVPLVLFSIILHEIAHGFLAYLYGDDTAKTAKRLTLNPIPHLDVAGTLIVPGVFLLISAIASQPPFVVGWARPMPINPYKLKNPHRNMTLVALAGPLTNFFLALLFSAIGHILSFALPFFNVLAAINIILFTFNILPIPPLDGARCLAGILPRRFAQAYMKTEHWGIAVLGLLLILQKPRELLFLSSAAIGAIMGIDFFQGI